MAVETTQEIDINLLQPHPRNVEIYGEEDVSELVEYIRDSKWIKPLVISQNNRIISGHRRWLAARTLGYARVPFVRQIFETDTDELKALLLENASREKTPEQRVREGAKWKEIEDKEARERKVLAGGDKVSVFATALRENFPEALDKGRARDKVAERVGFGTGRTYEKAAKVVETADQMKDEGKVEEAQVLLKVLNKQSVNAATRVLSMPEPQKKAVIQKLAEAPKPIPVKEAVQAVRKEEKQAEVAQLQKIDVIPAPANLPRLVEPGQIWRLGRHLLYCGDSSSEAFRTKALRAAAQIGLFALAFADPPYNAGVAEWDHAFEWGHDYLASIVPVVAVTPGIASIQNFMLKTKMNYRWSMAYWLDNGMTRGALGFGNWIYVALFANNSIYRNKQDFERVSISSNDRDELDHKGRKPLAMMLHMIKTFTDEGQIVLDPFLGTGTTLIVCEQTNRVCVGAEINPEYCSSIIRRWEKTTGQEAALWQ